MDEDPFEYAKPLAPRDMVDREDQLEALSDQLIATHNSRLIGPRRYGKTTLINAALERARDDGLIAVKVNFLGVLTLDDVAERIERAYREQLEGRLRHWFTGVVRTLQPTATAGGGPVPASISVAPRSSTRSLLDRLALPVRMHEKQGRRCAIAFDEFQDVMRAAGNADAVIRSEIENHAGIAGYVFSGSHVGMMRELFADRRRAFFGQATAIDLPRLSSEELSVYIAERFERHGRDPGDGLAPLIDLADGHPQRALMLASKLFSYTPPDATADAETWGRALEAACREADPEVTRIWEDLSSTAQRVLALVADGRVPLNSRAARERFGLPKTGSNRQALRQLADDAHVAQAHTATGWAVVDPLLALWLRHGRTWPLERGVDD